MLLLLKPGNCSDRLWHRKFGGGGSAVGAALLSTSKVWGSKGYQPASRFVAPSQPFIPNYKN